MSEKIAEKSFFVEKNDEFDILLGGEISLPTSVTVEEFVNSRVNELEALSEAIENPQRTAMIFQQLPKRMRRRVMSHNAKRMPNRLKQAHNQMLDKCSAREVGKRPSRKYRRRPKNLREEYARRQRTNVWLETHIWHAKRFHMANKWGYRIADFPNDKCFRACYRASNQHCLLQDVSFLCCIELNGCLDEIISGLARLSEDSFKRKPQLIGSREGSALVKTLDGQPIGEVTFIWRGGCSDQNLKQLWIWCHPVFYDELLGQMNIVFSSSQITKTSLKDQLLRFRLTGPKSVEVISGGLKFISEDLSKSWLSSYYLEDSRVHALKIQSNYYKNFRLLTNPGQLPPRSILPAIVTVSMPNLPYLMREREIDTDITLEKPVVSVDSPLWCPELRLMMKQANEEARNQARKSVKLVPGEGNIEGNTPVAILIIHREGRQNDHIGYGCGLDIICPSGWGMRVWLSLVHNGGRVCGIRESILFDMDTSLKPTFVLNSNSFKEHENDRNFNRREKHFRLPPAKRPNYQKLGVPNPFDLPWDLLKREWNCSDLIRVSVISEGKLDSSSQIYLPRITDLENRNKPPVEHQHSDSTYSERNQIKTKHHSALKRMAKERKRLRLKNIPKIELPSSLKLIEEHKNKIEELWLGTIDSVRNLCSRQIMGFVTDGSYSYLNGKCAGYGYITSSALEELKTINTDYLVLVRTTISLQYRFATITPVSS